VRIKSKDLLYDNRDENLLEEKNGQNLSNTYYTIIFVNYSYLTYGSEAYYNHIEHIADLKSDWLGTKFILICEAENVLSYVVLKKPYS
jgi:hypothetical protein